MTTASTGAKSLTDSRLHAMVEITPRKRPCRREGLFDRCIISLAPDEHSRIRLIDAALLASCCCRMTANPGNELHTGISTERSTDTYWVMTSNRFDYVFKLAVHLLPPFAPIELDQFVRFHRRSFQH